MARSNIEFLRHSCIGFQISEVWQTSEISSPFLHNLDFFLRQPMQLIHQRVNLPEGMIPDLTFTSSYVKIAIDGRAALRAAVRGAEASAYRQSYPESPVSGGSLFSGSLISSINCGRRRTK